MKEYTYIVINKKNLSNFSYTCCLLFIFFKPKLKRKKQKQKHFPYPVKIWGTCNMREACLGPEQDVAIQEVVMVGMLLLVPQCLIARRTKVVVGVTSRSSIVKACNARQIQSHQANSTEITPHTHAFQDVVKREDFKEIQEPISIAVQTTEKIEVDPVVSVLNEELDELIEANSPIAIRIH